MMLAMLMASIFMLTYSARIQTGDTLRFFDAVSSQVRYGDWLRDETLWLQVPDVVSTERAYPLGELDIEERLHIQIATVLYRLADVIPAFGYVHTVWLFNIIVSALAVSVFYWLAITRGYTTGTAVLAAFVLGIGTLLWPYSTTFFRGPLVLLFLLTTVLLWEQWREGGYGLRGRAGLRLAGGLALVFAAVSVKFSALMALPALGVLILPSLERFKPGRRFQRLSLSLLIAIPGLLAVLVFADPAFDLFTQVIELTPIRAYIPTELLPTGYFARTYVHLREALHTYFFSIGGSFWGTSPVLILAVPGLWLLHRRGELRWVWSIVLIVLGYAFGHALLSGEHWFGGLSWPPRFLLPTIPFVMLGTLPVLARLTAQPRRWFFLGFFALLVLYSVWIQFNAVSVDLTQYPKSLPEESSGLVEWGGGLNLVEYLRWVRLPSLWPSLGFDFAWYRADLPLWAVSLAILSGASGVIIGLLLRGRNLSRWSLAAMPLAWFLVVGLGLAALSRTDGLYRSDRMALHEVLDILRADAQTGDVILLADDTHARFFLNANDLTWPRFLILPPQPGEAVSDRQPAQVESNNLYELIQLGTIRALEHTALKHDRAWFLAHTGPLYSWSVRPIERYLTTYHYFLRELPTPTPDPGVRLLEFAMVDAPNPDSYVGPQFATDLRYGESIRLDGFTLPVGDVYNPGAVVPLSLFWVTETPLDQNYRVAWFLASEGAVIVHGHEGRDVEPAAGFAPTSTWLPGIPVWDNRALRLPDDLTAGDYQLWVILYSVQDEIVRLPVTGQQVVEGNIGVLPITIQVID